MQVVFFLIRKKMNSEMELCPEQMGTRALLICKGSIIAWWATEPAFVWFSVTYFK